MKINKKGVSLPELLAVIVIMGLIAAISIPAFSSMIKNAKKDKILAEAKQLFAKVESTFKAENKVGTADITMETLNDLVDDYHGDIPIFSDVLSLYHNIDFDTYDNRKLIIDFDTKLDVFNFSNKDCNVDGKKITADVIDDLTRACVK